MTTWKRAGLGALVGTMLALPLAVVLYAGRLAWGLPFPPFDLFDWLARALPGALVTAGIDGLVTTLRIVGLSTADVAKTAEQLLALVIFLVGAAVLGGLVTTVWRRPPGRREYVLTGATALLFTVAFVTVDAAVGGLQPGPAPAILWLLVAGAAWASALGWAINRLSAPARSATVDGGPPSASVEVVNRRSFLLRLGGASALVTVAGAALALRIREESGVAPDTGPRWSSRNPLPNAGADVEPARGTRPEFTPIEDHYQIDINTSPPRIDGASWRLRVGGLVSSPMELSLPELKRLPALHQFVTLACISNPIGGSLISTTRWTGVPVRDVLDAAGLHPEGTHVRIRAADGFHEVVARELFEEDERVMLTYAWDGVPLPAKHGFPLRIYIPDRYGMKQPKWIESVEVLDRWEEGYWVQRSWDRQARMRATSVIDTIGMDMMVVDADSSTRIPVGGIAHAGARGISSVEVRVDDGPWEPARLRTPLSDRTWVIWRYDWPFQEGEHTLTVRCTDGAGQRQVEERSPVRPDGATGLHRLETML